MVWPFLLPAPPVRTGPKEPALRKARICYDHLAGKIGVALHDRALGAGWLAANMGVTDKGWSRLALIGLHPEDLPRSNRPLRRACLDWSQHRRHLAGWIGKRMLDRIVALAWARRMPSSRIISFAPDGERLFAQWLR